MQKPLMMQLSAFSEYNKDAEIICSSAAKPHRSDAEPLLSAVKEEELREGRTQVQVWWVCCWVHHSSPYFLPTLLSRGTITSSFVLKKRKYDAVDQHCFCHCNKTKWDPGYSAITSVSQTYWPSLRLLMCETLSSRYKSCLSFLKWEQGEKKKREQKNFTPVNTEPCFIFHFALTEYLMSVVSISWFITHPCGIKDFLTVCMCSLSFQIAYFGSLEYLCIFSQK